MFSPWDIAGLGLEAYGAFGHKKDPFAGANEYMNQIPDQMGKYMDPYINAGRGSMDMLQGQYGNLLNDPGGMLNKMGSSYHQSPGFQFALQQALQGSGHAAAAGGMAGTPQHEQQNMQLATNLGNQDYNNYLDRTLGLYGKGLSGEEGMTDRGFNASQNMANQIAQMLAQQAQMKFSSDASRNQGRSGFISDVASRFM